MDTGFIAQMMQALDLPNVAMTRWIAYIQLFTFEIQHNPGVMVHLVHFVRMPLTISDHLQLCLPTLRFHSDTHCISSHNHATPVAGLNSDQCLISLDFVPMSQAATYLSFSPYAAFA